MKCLSAEVGRCPGISEGSAANVQRLAIVCEESLVSEKLSGGSFSCCEDCVCACSASGTTGATVSASVSETGRTANRAVCKGLLCVVSCAPDPGVIAEIAGGKDLLFASFCDDGFCEIAGNTPELPGEAITVRNPDKYRAQEANK